MSTSTATAYKYSVAGHLSFGAPKCEKAQKSSGFWANRTYRLCIKDNVLIDPCMGSGHILCVLFDVLVRIYEDYGYTAREAAVKIVENNLWGLDIDDRAAQLSYFAVMMKARQYDRRFFTRKVQPHVYAIGESNGITSAPMHDMGLHLTQEEYGEAVKQAMRLVEEMHDAKEYGSIIHVTPCDWDLLRRFAVPRDEDGQLHLDIHGEIEASARLQVLINVGEALAQKYHAVVTNPPYMGASNMNPLLGEYIKKNYPDSKSDASTAFMERTLDMCKPDGYMSMINIPVWMFLSSYEKLRNKMMRANTYINMVHPGRGIFGSDFGSITFVIAKQHISGYIGSYRRLFDEQVEVKSPEIREQQFLSGKGTYTARQDNFAKIPGVPVAYWCSSAFISMFDKDTIADHSLKVCKGGFTGNNDKYLRLWFEVSYISIPEIWHYYSKGGNYRKWYGNSAHCIYWENDGFELKNSPKAGVGASQYYGLEHVVWSGVSISKASFRYDPANVFFDDVSPAVVFPSELNWGLLGMLNSKVSESILQLIAPTIHFQAGDIKVIPYDKKIDEISTIRIIQNVSISKSDWDAFETSWDFQRHPLIRSVSTVEEAYACWEQECNERFFQLKSNEEELNRIFIDIYGLQNELTPEVDNKDVTVRQADLKRDIKSLISYAVGCMFGRYSLDVPGLAYAGGEWDDSKYVIFLPDADAILPICDDEYFEDDIVGRFVKFVEVVYGKDTLEENLRFIADALDGKGSSREIIRAYFLNDFFKDHCSAYSVTGSGKRPIYWLFDSGKKNGFKCLIYMHRYQPDTIARIRTDYVHEQQSRYRTAIADLEQRMNGVSTSERVKLNKQLVKLQAQVEEIRVYEEKIHHLADQMIKIDLDDGVKHNYEIFKDVLAKIK